jgi:hypothetical protein
MQISSGAASEDQKAFADFLARYEAAEDVHRHRLDLVTVGHPEVSNPVGEGSAVGQERMPPGASTADLLSRVRLLHSLTEEWKAGLADALRKSRRLLLLGNRHLLRFVQACQEPPNAPNSSGFLAATAWIWTSQNEAKLSIMTLALLPYVLLW